MAQASIQDSERPSTRTREPATNGRLRGGALASPEASEYEKMTREHSNPRGIAECAVQYCGTSDMSAQKRDSQADPLTAWRPDVCVWILSS